MNNLNVLLITVDDMNYNSAGCWGCKTPDITPNIDRLASEGMKLNNAHVAIAVCQPSRSVLMTGRYPHRNGARGFEPIDFCVTTLTERLREYGYYNGVIGKVDHVEPREKFAWDSIVKTMKPEENWGRDPEKMYEHTKEFLNKTKSEGKPFFLMANSHDPHRPFAGSKLEVPEVLCRSGKRIPFQKNDDSEYFRGKYIKCERYYEPDEIDLPGFLPDLPEVRREVADYFSSVHRGDAAVGRILDALDEEGFYDNTLVLFLSDNGAALPFAKTNCYLNSTKSPFIFRFPEVISAGSECDALISAIDYTPTVLDLLGIPQIDGTDGKSIRNILTKGAKHQYDTIFTQFFKTAANETTNRARHYPMRCVQSTKYMYIYNAWSNQNVEFLNDSRLGLTFAAMEKAAETNEDIRKRVEFFKYRISEEFYDVESDPDCLKNLMDDKKYRSLIDSYRKKAYKYMVDSQDGLVAVYKDKVLEQNYI